MKRRIVLILLLLPLLPLVSQPPLAANECWNGTIVQVDGVTHVRNAATSKCPPKVYDLVPRWTLSSDDESGFIFGAIVDAALHPSGVWLLLDQQLCTVHVVSADGEYLRSIGQEGEGPGDFRYPNTIHITQDGIVGVADISANRVLFLGLDGEVLGEWKPRTPGYPRASLLAIARLGDNYLATVELHRLVDGAVEDVVMVGIYDDEGDLLKELQRNTITRPNPRVMEYDEALADAKLLLGSDGQSQGFYSLDYSEYRFARCTPDGQTDLIVERDLAPWKRDRDTAESIERYWKELYRRYDDAVITLSPYDRSVHSVTEWTDGSLWVETSHGWYGPGSGDRLYYDIYDQDGRFCHAAVLDYDINRADDVVFLRAGAVVIVTAGSLLNEAAMVGGGAATASRPESTAEPMIIVGDVLPRE